MSESTTDPNQPSGAIQPGRARGPWRVLLLDLVILSIVLVVGECVLRVWDPRFREHLFDETYTGGHPIALNQDGLRGPRVPKQKPPGEFRVLALGDSITYGVGVAAEDTWPAQLQRALGAHGPATTVNGSSPGVALRDLGAAIHDDWAGYHADVAVLGLSANHVAWSFIKRSEPGVFEPEHARPPDPSALQRYKRALNQRVKTLSVPSFLTLNNERFLYAVGVLDHLIDAGKPFGAMLAHGIRELTLDPALAPEAWELTREELRKLRQELALGGTPLFVTMMPARFDLTDRAADNEKSVPLERFSVNPDERARAICRDLGVPYIDSYAALRAARAQEPTARAPLYIQGDYTHFDRTGGGVVAAAIARELEPLRAASRRTGAP